MNDLFFKYARDPSCLLALTPDRGGSWWSPLRADRPRNFLSSQSWNGLAGLGNIGAIDFTFRFSFEVLGYGENDSVNFSFLDTDDGNRIKIYRNFIRVAAGSSGYVTPWNHPAGGFLVPSVGRHSVVIARQGGLVRVTVDGEISDVAVPESLEYDFSTYYRSNFNGTISELSLHDDTNDAMLFEAARAQLYETNYPWPSPTPDETPGLSEAERVRLITKTNVRTDRGVFEAAVPAQAARVDTALDLRKSGSLTLVWRGFFSLTAPNSVWIAWGSYDSQRMALTYSGLRAGNQLQFRCNWTGSGGVDCYGDFVSDAGEQTVACVADFEAHRVRLQVGARLLKEVAIPVGVTRFDLPESTAANRFTLGEFTGANVPRSTGVLVFDRALSAGEIAAMAGTE